MDGVMAATMLPIILQRLPHLLGVLLVAGAGIWGLTRPRKAAGTLALTGAGLAALIWLGGSTLSVMSLLASVRRDFSAAQLGPVLATSGCVTGVLDLVAWALIAAALVVAMRNQSHADG